MKRKKLLGYIHLPTYSTEKYVEIFKDIEKKVREGWAIIDKYKINGDDPEPYKPHTIKITLLETSLDGCVKYIMDYPEYDDIYAKFDMIESINAAFRDYVYKGNAFIYNSTNTVRFIEINEDGDITNRAELSIVGRNITSMGYEQSHTKCVFRHGGIIENNEGGK